METQLKLYSEECDKAIKSFMGSFNYLKQKFNTSKTPKIHIILDHLLDIIEIIGEPLGSLDQCIEALHQLFKQRMKTHLCATYFIISIF